MTPGQIRVLLATFAIASCGVGINAVFLQPALPTAGAGRVADKGQRTDAARAKRLVAEATAGLGEPVGAAASAVASAATVTVTPDQRAAASAKRSAKAPEETATRVGRLKTDAATAEIIPAPPDAESDPDVIRAVQRELAARGYGAVAADGVAGLSTRAAIMAFEHDNRLALTGEATEALLKRLLLGAPGDRTGEPGAGKVRSAHAEIVIRTVQQSLFSLGYQPGRTDGRLGEETERAIREFEMDHGLVPSGRISADLFGRLGRAVAGGKPATATR